MEPEFLSNFFFQFVLKFIFPSLLIFLILLLEKLILQREWSEKAYGFLLLLQELFLKPWQN